MNLTTKLLILIFLSVLFPILVFSYFIKSEITGSILREKEDKLFGLARQLDRHLTGSFEDILRKRGALEESRERKIAILNEELRAITDAVASGNAGVGVGYYGKDLDAILTYGPSAEFQYTVGQSISASHRGRDVMAEGKPLVQQGMLVRGNILNCMWPIVRGERTIGYIWANETLDQVAAQIMPILQRIYGLLMLIFMLIYASVTISTRTLLDKIYRIKKGIEVLFVKPTAHLPPIKGELSIIVDTINELVDNMNFVKCYNKNVLESVWNGVLAVDLDGRVSRANRAFFQLFTSLDEGSLIGRDYRDAFDGRIRDILRDGLDVPGFHPSTEVLLRSKRLEIYGNSMIDEDGIRLGAVFVFRDVTVARKYEQEVKEKERALALGEMALGVVHEVKNPLTSVKGFAQLLTRPGITEGKRTEYARLIDSELNRVNRLLNEMLAFGGKSRLEPHRCDLLSLLSGRIDARDWSGVGGKPEVRVSAGRSFNATVDAVKLSQVFDNVLKNAQDAVAAKGSGRVLVLGRSDGRKVCLCFVDLGVGIRGEDLEKVGIPLFSTKSDGTGLGLAISRKILEAHGGALDIQSKHGFYTKVTVTVPKTLNAKEACQ